MKLGMRASRHYLEITWVIVPFITVTVMDNSTRSDFTVKLFLHNPSVNEFTGVFETSIALLVDVSFSAYDNLLWLFFNNRMIEGNLKFVKFNFGLCGLRGELRSRGDIVIRDSHETEDGFMGGTKGY